MYPLLALHNVNRKNISYRLNINLAADGNHASSFVTDSETFLSRQKRLTCDFLSVSFGGINFQHSACAFHCLLKLKRGGTCVNGICLCR